MCLRTKTVLPQDLPCIRSVNEATSFTSSSDGSLRLRTLCRFDTESTSCLGTIDHGFGRSIPQGALRGRRSNTCILDFLVLCLLCSVHYTRPQLLQVNLGPLFLCQHLNNDVLASGVGSKSDHTLGTLKLALLLRQLSALNPANIDTHPARPDAVIQISTTRC